MIDHINLRVADYERSKKFYQALLAPLGYKLAMEGISGAGFTKSLIPDFWVKEGQALDSSAPAPESGCGGPAIHIAFASDNRQMVNEFYKTAIAAGACDNGAPGLRPEYHPNYYGAFVLDPDGYNIEVVCHKAE